MSLSVTSGGTCSDDVCTVLGGSFVVAVSTDPAPDVEISGFNTEVVFPEGLAWNQTTCEEEVQVGLQDEGTEFGVCEAVIGVLRGGASHAVLAPISFPLPALDIVAGSVTTLVSLNFDCVENGVFTLVLTASPPSVSASVFSGLEANEIPITTTTTAVIGEETLDVADTLDIDCGGVTGPITGTGPIGADGGSNVALLTLMGALLAAGAGLSAFGWRYARAK